MNFKRLIMLLSERRIARKAYRYYNDWIWSIWSDIEKCRCSRVAWQNRIRMVNSPFLETPVYLRIGTSDWFIFEEIFLHGEYSFVMQGSGSPVINILDLESNIGLSIRYWLTLFPKAKIIGVEPDRASFEMAKLNIGRSAKLFRACVDSSPGIAYINSRGLSCGFTVTKEITSPNAEAVNALTISDIKEKAGIEGNIDLLKCDIEGSEREVFQNCSDWIGCVKRIAIEIHPPYTVAHFLRDIERGGSQLRVKASKRKQHLHTLFLAE